MNILVHAPLCMYIHLIFNNRKLLLQNFVLLNATNNSIESYILAFNYGNIQALK